VDVRERAIYWARARPGREGLVPLESGARERDPRRSLEAQLAEWLPAAAAGSSLEVAFHSSDLFQERAELPGLTRSELRVVAERRLVAPRRIPGAQVDLVMPRGRGAGPVWATGAALDDLEALAGCWESRGVEPHRIASRHLTLGWLAARLRGHAEGLVALFDLESDYATCVVADEQGWIFSREVPFKFMGDRLVRISSQDEGVDASGGAGEAEVSGGAVVAGGIGGDGGFSLPLHDELSDLAGAARSDPDFLERVAADAERLDTELRRTFQYLEGELRLSKVGQVILAGESEELSALAPALEESLGVPVRLLGGAACDLDLAGGEVRPGSSVVLGLALAPDRRSGNLLPEPRRRRRRELRVRRGMQAALAAAGVLLALLLGNFAWELRALQEASAALDARWEQHADARERMQEARSARMRASELQQLLAALDPDAPRWTALLQTFAALAPAELAIQRWSVHRVGPAEPSEERSDPGREWATTLVLDARGSSVSEAAEAVATFARALKGAPLLVVDRVEREPDAPARGDAEGVRLQFHLEGRLAVVGSQPAEAEHG